MIKLFTKSRKKALTESRLGKYLFYAIGEILLVVIGILIALQINTSNQKLVQNQKTNVYLKTLNTEIQSNIKRIDFRIEWLQDDLRESVGTLKHLNSESATTMPLNDLYQGMATRPIFKSILSNSTFDDLINSGTLEYLEDEDLKSEILKMGDHNDMIQIVFEDAQDIWDNYQSPYHVKHTALVNSWDSLSNVKIPKFPFIMDREAFVYNREYSNILAIRMRMVSNYEEILIDVKENLEELSLNINTYLNE